MIAMRAAVLITLSQILGFALAYPTPGQNDDNNTCLVMTPERQKQVNHFVEKIAQYINKISNEHPNIIITEVHLNIEKHLNKGDKETSMSVSINDCDDDEDSSDVSSEFDDEQVEKFVVADVSQDGDDNVLESKTIDESCTESESDNLSEQVDEVNYQDIDCGIQSDDVSDTSEDVAGNENSAIGQTSQSPFEGLNLPKGIEVVLLNFTAQEEQVMREVEKIRGKKPFLMFERHLGDGQQLIIL